MICRVFLIIRSIKCFEIGQYHRVEKLYEKASILFQFSYWAILAPFQVVAKNPEENSSVGNCAVHVP